MDFAAAAAQFRAKQVGGIISPRSAHQETVVRVILLVGDHGDASSAIEVKLYELFVIEIEECAKPRDQDKFCSLLREVIEVLLRRTPEFLGRGANPIDVWAKAIASSE